MLARFHPLVEKWFQETFGKPSDPQRKGWPAIASGGHTLILAPTGTGKTLAAFLWELNELIVRGTREPLPNAVHLLYISPLKALNNDIQRNLDRPLRELRERFAAEGDRKSTRLNSSHRCISYDVFCLKKKKTFLYWSLREGTLANVPAQQGVVTHDPLLHRASL